MAAATNPNMPHSCIWKAPFGWTLHLTPHSTISADLLYSFSTTYSTSPLTLRISYLGESTFCTLLAGFVWGVLFENPWLAVFHIWLLYARRGVTPYSMRAHIVPITPPVRLPTHLYVPRSSEFNGSRIGCFILLGLIRQQTALMKMNVPFVILLCGSLLTNHHFLQAFYFAEATVNLQHHRKISVSHVCDPSYGVYSNHPVIDQNTGAEAFFM